MAMISEKENLIRMHKGEMPAFLPRGGFRDVKCSVFVNIKEPGYHKDEFGVEYDGKPDVFGGAPMPIPGRYVLDDITKWRDVIKAPDFSDIDWEAYAKKDLANIDRENVGIAFYFGKVFQRLADFMGFEEGLCAIAEEPEEVYALYDYLTTFYEGVLKNVLPHYKPDAVCIPDDTATARAPFISRKAYQELVLPFHKRIADLVLNHGAFIEMHDCGKCDDFVEDWMNIGISSWNPAQPSNDLVGIKEKYGRKLIIAGGWDTQGAASFPETDEEVFVDILHNYVDTLAPNGGFVFSAYVGGGPDNPVTKKRNQMINDFYQNYARPWYDNH